MAHRTDDWELNSELQELADMGQGLMVAEILREFIEDAEGQIARAEKAVERCDGAELTFVAHTLTGSAATVGLQDFSSVAYQLQMLARAQKFAESLLVLEDLRKQFPSAKQAVNQAISQLKPPSI
jgi:HPt (histidine-containing phosphotransfer) domain-containing protein